MRILFAISLLFSVTLSAAAQGDNTVRLKELLHIEQATPVQLT
jgi:hypothetical protein